MSSVREDGLFKSFVMEGWDLTVYLIRVVFQRAVVTVVPHTVPVSVSLVHVINVRAVVVLIQNIYPGKIHLLSFLGLTPGGHQRLSGHVENSLTVTINVDSAGVALSVVVGVSLVSVSLVNAVVTAIADIVSVCVILGRVVQSRAVVLDDPQ